MKRPRSLREALKGKLTKKEFSELVTSFDMIGSVAVIEIAEELEHKDKEIGKALLTIHPNLKTVCKRVGIHRGKYRVRAIKVIAGKKDTKTLYKEHGVLMKLDVNKTYFSPRLSHERERIARQVKPKEVIGAWFAGVGPFPLVIAKKQSKVGKVYAVELNPEAFRCLEENVRINKLSDKVIPVKGDVKVLASSFPKLDRILMPLPKEAVDFLPEAFSSVKKGGIIHLYSFGRREDPFSGALERISLEARKRKRRIRIIEKREVLPYSPGAVQVVVDFKVL